MAYSSEEEQIEAIKKWWRDNGAAVVLGVIVGLGGLFGWQAWEKYQNRQAEQASSIYSELLAGLENEQYASMNPLVDQLIADYAGTPYAALGALAGAKAAVATEDAQQAISRLQWVVKNGKQDEVVDTARLRLARLHLIEGNPEAAEKLLDGGYSPAFDSLRNELLGDLHAAKGDKNAARDAYDRALAAAGSNRQTLEIKRNALGEAPPTEDDSEMIKVSVTSQADSEAKVEIEE